MNRRQAIITFLCSLFPNKCLRKEAFKINNGKWWVNYYFKDYSHSFICDYINDQTIEILPPRDV